MLKHKQKKQLSGEEKMFQATQWQLMVRKFRKHKLAQVGLWVLVVLYTLVRGVESRSSLKFQLLLVANEGASLGERILR